MDLTIRGVKGIFRRSEKEREKDGGKDLPRSHHQKKKKGGGKKREKEHLQVWEVRTTLGGGTLLRCELAEGTSEGHSVGWGKRMARKMKGKQQSESFECLGGTGGKKADQKR